MINKNIFNIESDINNIDNDTVKILNIINYIVSNEEYDTIYIEKSFVDKLDINIINKTLEFIKNVDSNCDEKKLLENCIQNCKLLNTLLPCLKNKNKEMEDLF